MLPGPAVLPDTVPVINPGECLHELDNPPPLPVRLLNVDLSTVTAGTDIVFGLGDPLPEVVHIDAQAGPDAKKHSDLLAYHGLLHRQYQVPVHSILLLLRRQAAHGDQTGAIAYAPRPGHGKMDFGYEIVRLWEHPVERLLASGLATLPLAPLCKLPAGLSDEEGIRWAVTWVVERLQRDGTPTLVQRLLTATFVLTGLRLDRSKVRALFQGVRAMRESDTYQAIPDEGREEGRAEGAQRILLHQACKKLGEPDETSRRTLLGITDLNRLDRLSERLLEVSTWQELLQTP